MSSVLADIVLNETNFLPEFQQVVYCKLPGIFAIFELSLLNAPQ